MPEVVIVVTGPAPYLGCLTLHQRDNGVVCHSAAFDAVIVNDIA